MSTLFLSCDWGTSSFRLRLVERTVAGLVVVEDNRTGVGVAAVRDRIHRERLSPDEAFRLALIPPLEAVLAAAPTGRGARRIVISGMVGSTIGWREVPYARLPFALDGSSVNMTEAGVIELVGGTELRALLVGGVAAQHDVARGEEVELMGILASPTWQSFRRACIAVLPGTHSKQMLVRQGALVDFKTFLTGELYSLLIDHSVLRHSLQAGAAFDETAFTRGVQAALSGGLLGALFSVRARQLLDAVPPGANSSYLSGILLGAEAEALARWGDDQLPVLLCASPALAPGYRLALELVGLGSRLHVVPPAEVEVAAVLGHQLLLQRMS